MYFLFKFLNGKFDLKPILSTREPLKPVNCVFTIGLKLGQNRKNYSQVEIVLIRNNE